MSGQVVERLEGHRLKRKGVICGYDEQLPTRRDDSILVVYIVSMRGSNRHTAPSIQPPINAKTPC
jgi:hypothetical protein